MLSGAVYHCQQAFEEALKAFLVWHSQPVPRTHALPDVVILCGQIDSAFGALAVSAAQITPYGTAFRYPPIVAGLTDLAALDALDAAHDVMAFVLARLPGTVHP